MTSQKLIFIFFEVGYKNLKEQHGKPSNVQGLRVLVWKLEFFYVMWSNFSLYILIKTGNFLAGTFG